MNRDVKIGIAVVVVVVTALAGVVAHTRSKGLRFELEFEDGANLKAGDSVYMQGVDVGEVLDLDLTASRKVMVKLRLKERFCRLVPHDASFLIVNDKFIFGKKAVLVVPRTPAGGAPVREGQVIKGVEGYTALYVNKGTAEVREIWGKVKGWVKSVAATEETTP